MHYLDQGNTAQKKQRTEQFTFELRSPAKTASPVAQSTSKLPSKSPKLSDTSLQSSGSDDGIQPHPSPATNIVINLDNYSNSKSADQENSSNKVNCVYMNCSTGLHFALGYFLQ